MVHRRRRISFPARWHARFEASRRAHWRSHGLDPIEVEWAVEHHMPITGEVEKRLAQERLHKVKFFMRRFNIGWDEAVFRAAEARREKLRYEGQDEDNLYYEVSP